MNLNESITLRPATEEDVEFRRQLYYITRMGELAALGWNDQQKTAFLEMQFRVQGQSYALIYPQASDRIIELDTQPAGRFLIENRPSEVVFIDLALLPEFQGKGIGSYVFRTEMDLAAKAGKPIRLGVLRGNPAVALYERLGFSVIGEDPIYLQMLWKAPAGQS